MWRGPGLLDEVGWLLMVHGGNPGVFGQGCSSSRLLVSEGEVLGQPM